jgi:DNA primase
MRIANHAHASFLIPRNHEVCVVDGRADFDAKERIRQSIDIVDLVGSYLELRRQGRHFVARCPWHDDSKPSLTINQERQSWKCWVCNVGGDAFSFVMKKENIDFREALELLAERANIQLTPSTSAPVQPGSPQDKKTLYEAMAWVERAFHECLLKADVAASARNYLQERGISAESVEQFKIGFSPMEWSWLIDHARFTKFTPEILEACGVLARSSQTNKVFDFFRGRITFPIADVQGRPIAFGARVLPEYAEQLRGKYINTPETKLFSKSDHLYAINFAREEIAKSRNITVVEGYTDVIMAHQFGAKDVVAVLGTALGPRHIQHLKRYADRITLVLDGDAAGQRRTNEILELFVAAQVDLQIVTLPEEFDPCELFLERGLEYWREVMSSAVDALEHKIRAATRGIDLVHDTHRANQALEEILSTLSKAPSDAMRSADAFKLRQQQVLSRLAKDFRVSESDVRERLKEIRKQQTTANSTRESVRNAEPAVEVPYVITSASALDSRERELLELLVKHPALAITALQEISPEDLANSAARDIFRTYRELEEDGSDLEFALVLSALPNEQLQSLLVEIDEKATEKDAKALQEPSARLRTVIDRIKLVEKQREQREQLSALESQKLESEDELSILQQMLELNRRRMGIHLN